MRRVGGKNVVVGVADIWVVRKRGVAVVVVRRREAWRGGEKNIRKKNIRNILPRSRKKEESLRGE